MKEDYMANIRKVTELKGKANIVARLSPGQTVYGEDGKSLEIGDQSQVVNDVHQLIIGYALLVDDWDTYGATAPSVTIIQNAQRAVAAFESAGVDIHQALPDAAGRITLYFSSRAASFEVSIDESVWGVLVERPKESDEFLEFQGDITQNVQQIVSLA